MAVVVSGPLVGSGAFPPDPVINLLYASGTQVTSVMVAGAWQLFDSKLHVGQEEDSIIRNGGRVAGLIWDQLRDEGWFED